MSEAKANEYVYGSFVFELEDEYYKLARNAIVHKKAIRRRPKGDQPGKLKASWAPMMVFEPGYEPAVTIVPELLRALSARDQALRATGS